MKTKKNVTAARQILAMGLFSTVIPTIINDFVPVPDFLRGFALGLGLTLEIIGLIFIRREKSSVCNHGEADAEI